jgi:hypothetical protein
MLLVTFFLAVFGTTAHFGVNIIYDAAFVCMATAFFISWRRPSLRWQVLGGAVTFTVIYGVVLAVVDLYYPTFYRDSRNLQALSGYWLGHAPAEEYVFAFTFGMMWAPLYEAWKEERST